MEEAYNELYQQFLRLRSLCLRQAALLHQLTTALQKQQGVTVSNGGSSDMMSIPVQCTQEIPAYLHENPHSLPAAAYDMTFSDLLTEDMSKLHVCAPRQRKENLQLAPNVAPLISPDSSKCPGASANLMREDHFRGDGTLQMGNVAVTNPPSLNSDFSSQSGGLLMSDVAPQSDVCDFCQAVFPGDTTTRGEFLRHLYTHVT
uniref:uncharacterized protein zgc:113184 n=1 Tax=Scatophagus argus TaxID=75038 RepID=UPI001ED81DB2|nr:uncharacterized protein zgc:113184 [Scatophagus argus]XP_046240100.1 uncharacterized protein zgc:113184 [Scatophagus argus]XP_046240101.1 uncharacterized protein zgc:113184 [Scatophagus argus]XP_046240102.1 uncharacterized protein zgc:113184 [Scatophagus argus]